MTNNHALISVFVASISTNALAQTSFSNGFEGWCASTNYEYEGEVDLHEAGDYPYGVRVTSQGVDFSTGEEGASCSFSNPTPVRDFDGALFDASCWSPYTSAMDQGYLLPRRAMLLTSTDDASEEPRAFIVFPNNILSPNIVEELHPCLSFKHSDLHFQLGYDEGFYQPNKFSPSVRYIADLIYQEGSGNVAQYSNEIANLQPNLGKHFIVGTTSCGMDCQYPFIFDVRSGLEVSLGQNLTDKLNNEEVGNFSFSMGHDDGRILLSWRDYSRSCILQEAQISGSQLTLQAQHITPENEYLFNPSQPLNCPKNK